MLRTLANPYYRRFPCRWQLNNIGLLLHNQTWRTCHVIVVPMKLSTFSIHSTLRSCLHAFLCNSYMLLHNLQFCNLLVIIIMYCVLLYAQDTCTCTYMYCTCICSKHMFVHTHSCRIYTHVLYLLFYFHILTKCIMHIIILVMYHLVAWL